MAERRMAFRRHETGTQPAHDQTAELGIGSSSQIGDRSQNGWCWIRALVFTAHRGGPIQEARFVGRYFKPLLRSAGLPNIRLYDLRHTAATLALVAGVSPKIVSEQLGHASVAFTLEVYSHVLPHMQETAAMKVEALLMAA
jgi:integrase